MVVLKPIKIVDNFKEIQREILDLVDKIGFEKNQIICQGLEENCADWYTGVGRIDELEEKDEKNYIHLNVNLKNTALVNFITDNRGYRTRIMSMPSRQCYSIHKDPGPRVHLPISTNSQCWMIWPTLSKCYRMPEGILFWTDTTKEHTFINGDIKDRIHLVMCIED